MTTNPSTGDTVIPTKTTITTITTGDEQFIPGLIKNKNDSIPARAESTPVARKRYLDSSSPKTEVPIKSPRRCDRVPKIVEEIKDKTKDRDTVDIQLEEKVKEERKRMCVMNDNIGITETGGRGSRPEVPRDKNLGLIKLKVRKSQLPTRLSGHTSSGLIRILKRSSEDAVDKIQRKSRFGKGSSLEREEPEDEQTKKKPPPITEFENSQPVPCKVQNNNLQEIPKRDEALKLRKTIQWLEEGARRMREDLASTRAELHEERRAARLARRELDSAVKEAKTGEAARHLQVISELKARLAQSPTRPGAEGGTSLTNSRGELLREENHRRELSALRKRLAEAEATVQKLKTNACNSHASNKRRKVEGVHGRRLEVEVQALRTANRKLEERMQVVVEAERKRAAELRIQHENHESQLAAMQKTLRSDTIKMMDEIRSKNREIEKLEKLVTESSQMHKKLQSKEDDLMRKLRETERNHQIRLTPRVGEKLSASTDHVEDSCNGDCDAVAEVERLRELSAEQQEVIEVLRQAVKEKERKLDQISNKKRKEEFYKQWLELEPVVEVEDEDDQDHGEGDSALSSAPSSLSPHSGGCGNWQQNGVTREAYETVLLEVEELQTRLVEEQRELAHAKSQVRELEKALLQETRGSQNSRRALSDKLREAEDHEAALVAEISELREQNELLEFRVLELEEAPGLRETPDPADSGIVSPEPIHLSYKKDRAVATVIPYNTYNIPVSPIPHKPPLSLQESGIFEEDDESEIELSSRGTQTETPAGDLLQEVQRLHELRARIQERAAVKVPSVGNKEIVVVQEILESGFSLASYQERIRELEERLAAQEEAEEKRFEEKQLSKQREEDLLDENYRLTEKIYWFENLIRNSIIEGNNCSVEDYERESSSETLKPGEIDSEEENGDKMLTENPEERGLSSPTLTEVDESMDVENSEMECKECGKIRNEVIERLEELVQAELISKQRIVDLERREAMYMQTLREADERWVKGEENHATQLEEFNARLELEISANKMLTRKARALEDKLNELRDCRCLPQENIKDQNSVLGLIVMDKNTDRENETAKSLGNPSSSEKETKKEVMSVTKILMPDVTAELATEAREEEEEKEEEKEKVKEGKLETGCEEVAAEVREVSLKERRGEEEEEEEEEEEVEEVVVEGGEALPEPVVTINETEPEKKVRESRERSKDRDRDRDRDRDWERDRDRDKEREGWVMKAWNNSYSIGRLGQDLNEHKIHRLVLYQELCV